MLAPGDITYADWRKFREAFPYVDVSTLHDEFAKNPLSPLIQQINEFWRQIRVNNANIPAR